MKNTSTRGRKYGEQRDDSPSHKNTIRRIRSACYALAPRAATPPHR